MSAADSPIPETVPARWWHAQGDRVVCDLCPRHCSLREGQRGLCFVRRNVGGRLVLTTWGRSSGFCVDPIEKKPLYHFLPGSPVLSFGTAGCNLACRFCQNWHISRSQEVDTLADSAMPDELADAALAAGCRSVAYTYNEPLIFLEYAVDVARACRERGIRNVAVTAGYVCDGPRREFFGLMDAANVDLKSFREDFYWRLCGGHLQDVLDTLTYLKQHTNVWVEVTTLLIPGANDSEDEVADLSRWVAGNLGPDVPLHFSAFHPAWKMDDLPRTPTVTLRRARRQALLEGMRFVYTGNVHDPEGASTPCPGCGETVIGRDGYDIVKYDLMGNGRCARCGAQIPGVFDGVAGDWGTRRRPLRLGGR